MKGNKMKVVILCGGKGTRLSEETGVRPKPMVEIGGKPILTHIMDIYSRHGYNEFVLALGFKGQYIKDYFSRYFLKNSDFSINLESGKIEYLKQFNSKWKISCIDTGLNSMTGGRLIGLRDYLGEEFMLTYGDGVADIDITNLVEEHRKSGKLATVTAVHPSARFGEMSLDGNTVTKFQEKPQTEVGWINGGFFVFNKKVLDLIKDYSTVLEREPLEQFSRENQLNAYKHSGFWQCMDTMRDKEYLDSLIEEGKAPWIW